MRHTEELPGRAPLRQLVAERGRDGRSRIRPKWGSGLDNRSNTPVGMRVNAPASAAGVRLTLTETPHVGFL